MAVWVPLRKASPRPKRSWQWLQSERNPGRNSREKTEYQRKISLEFESQNLEFDSDIVYLIEFQKLHFIILGTIINTPVTGVFIINGVIVLDFGPQVHASLQDCCLNRVRYFRARGMSLELIREIMEHYQGFFCLIEPGETEKSPPISFRQACGSNGGFWKIIQILPPITAECWS